LTTRPRPCISGINACRAGTGRPDGRQNLAQSGGARLEGSTRSFPALVPAAYDAGVVDQDVKAAELAAHELGQPPDAAVVDDVQLVEPDVLALIAQLVRGRFARARIASGQDDASALLRQLPAGLEAHAAIGAGHDGDLAGRALAHAPPPFLPRAHARRSAAIGEPALSGPSGQGVQPRLPGAAALCRPERGPLRLVDQPIAESAHLTG
jgi:hypothetical protein